MRRRLFQPMAPSGHPFRAVLPRANRPFAVQDAGWRGALALTRDDVRGFASSYVACLVAVIAFIF